ncbi:HesB/YadR/YfhF family protein [Virgibacillus sp. L01]|uniref:HesB/YadR/YfhF family protein n=1 Tax=Virgibacillus sp. L01 TaxID=3457429 RepID=UPI003FD6A86C
MNLQITKEAAKWYKKEFEIEHQTQLRFYVRYGFGGVIPGFSLGVSYDTPKDMHASCNAEGITFFIESKDAWYFDDQNLKIELDEQSQESDFIYF